MAKKLVVKLFFAIIIVLVIIGLAIYLYVYLYDNKAERHREKVNYELASHEIDSIQDGDIILRHGYGFVSDLIVRRLNEPVAISHCAIINKTDTAINVIQSLSSTVSDFDGVQVQPLEQFVRDSRKNSIVVLRYKYGEVHNGELVSQRARHYLEMAVPFDMGFNISDTSRFFCTELIWKVLLDAFYVDIFEKKKTANFLDLFKFDVFFDPDYFEVVWSHQPL